MTVAVEPLVLLTFAAERVLEAHCESQVPKRHVLDFCLHIAIGSCKACTEPQVNEAWHMLHLSQTLMKGKPKLKVNVRPQYRTLRLASGKTILGFLNAANRHTDCTTNQFPLNALRETIRIKPKPYMSTEVPLEPQVFAGFDAAVQLLAGQDILDIPSAWVVLGDCTG